MSKKSIKGIKLNKNINSIYKTKNNLFVYGILGYEKIKLKYKYFIFYKKKSIFIKIFSKKKMLKSILGTYHSIIKNLIFGVSKGFSKSLSIDGLGYYVKISKKDHNKLLFELGYSNLKSLFVDKKIKFNIEEKGKRIVLFCTNNILLGDFVNKILKLRKYNLYNGKGIKITNEIKVLKQRKKK
ncbi:hypothetical protein ACWNX6_00780 [Candidatus Vidania fulgoroideorum]